VQAAKRAGYKGNDGTLAAVAYENLRKPHIREAISKYLSSYTIKKAEIVWRLKEMAQADLSKFINTDNRGAGIDWDAVKKYGFLIKSMTPTRYGWKFELHDSQAALDKLARVYGMYNDKLQISWSERAAQEGVDVDSIYSAVVEEFTAAMVRSDDASGVGGSGTESGGDQEAAES
jgi:hypothetical protein